MLGTSRRRRGARKGGYVMMAGADVVAGRSRGKKRVAGATTSRGRRRGRIDGRRRRAGVVADRRGQIHDCLCVCWVCWLYS